jgi:hypothetical protein
MMRLERIEGDERIEGLGGARGICTSEQMTANVKHLPHKLKVYQLSQRVAC